MTTRQAVHAPRPADIRPVAHKSLDTALPMMALHASDWPATSST
jgi:hypothetical protein